MSTKRISAFVIGAGVSGCLSAIALKTSAADVTLTGKALGLSANYCMTVGPTFVRHLEALGLGPAWRNWQGKWERTAHCSAWGTNTWEGGVSLYDPSGPSYMVQRAALERFLLAQALLQGVKHHVAIIGPTTFPTRGTLVVDATGRAAFMARRLGGARRSLPPLVALHGQGPATSQDSGMTTLVSGPDGWWFSATMGKTTSICLVTAAHAHRRHGGNWRDAWRAALALQPALRHCALANDGLGRPILAGSSWLENPAGPGWFAVGDAALAMDPLSSGGAEFAAYTACLLRKVAAMEDAANAYTLEILARVGQYRVARQRLYRNCSMHYQTDFWKAQCAL